MSDLSSIAWVFVCQKGVLEREACLLAASLRSVLGDDANLTAAIPLNRPPRNSKDGELKHGGPSAETMDFLHALNVNCVTLTNPLIESSSPVRHSCLLMNKAYALQINRDAPIVVFLDSDQICYCDFDISNVSVPFVARRAFYPGAKATEGIWQRAYDLCKTTMPRQRIVARSRDADDPVIVCPPYFNSGFISVHRPWIDELIDNYIGCFQTISQHELLGRDRYFEEQMALAIAVMQTGVPYEIDNHRIDMSFFHYYSISRLAAFEKHRRRVIDLATQYPMLKELLLADGQWRNLLNDKIKVRSR